MQERADDERVVSVFKDKAERAMEQGDAEEARRWLEGVVELAPDDVDAWLRLAEVIPDPRERILCYVKVLEISPRNPQARAGIRRTRRKL